jgi:putative photosynthetic complex assembly protein 2
MPVLFALFLWWFSTGAVLFVIGLPRASYRWSMSVATAVGLAALYALFVTASDTSASGAYMAFTSALLVWGWHEMSFLTGAITGPRTTECPERRNGRSRLWPAVETLLYHELAILVTAIVIFAIVGDAPNQVGWWTFLVLWTLRLSAKFNVYLGVPNVTEEFLPPHLRYLKSYFCHRPMNWLFPISITASTTATALLIGAAVAGGANEFEITSATLIATLMGLAVLEHWFLVVPFEAAALWSWGMSSRDVFNAPALGNEKTNRDPTEKKPRSAVAMM